MNLQMFPHWMRILLIILLVMGAASKLIVVKYMRNGKYQPDKGIGSFWEMAKSGDNLARVVVAVNILGVVCLVLVVAYAAKALAYHH